MSPVTHRRIISSDVEEDEIEDHKSEMEEHKSEIEVEVLNEEKVERPNMELPEEKVERSNVEFFEEEFEGESVLTWKKQVTFRAIFVSLILSILFTFITMKLTLTTALTPPLNASCCCVNRQLLLSRNCVAASTGIAITGGFGSYLFGMSPSIAIQNSDASSSIDTKIPALGWMISFLFAVSFLGHFLAVPLRKLLVVDLKLAFSSATSTADLICGYHTTKGVKLAKEQIQTLGKYLSYSFLWGFFQWFFTAGEGCGFASFPTFGLEAYKETFYFDFSATYVGVGMMNPYITNISLLIGGILSWGIMWPFIEAKRGAWYDANLPKNSLSGFGGYQVFIPVGMVLGDGLYHFVKVLGHTLLCLYNEWNEKDKGFPSLGKQRSIYPAPYAQVYRNMAILTVDGVSALPNNCLTLFYWFLAAAIVINLIRDLVGKKYAHLIPTPIAMAIPFYIGSYYTIDMCVGSLIMFVWKIRDNTKADAFGYAVASGLICGDGIWSIPSSFLAFFKVKPPICMKFLSRAENARYIRF